ncbi:MAG: DUF4209 domain-containing protein [Gemmatimonadaceae bacterium]|nr:DUF4209 domain-containing protein [Gemmatimonadaceae bacterium]
MSLGDLTDPHEMQPAGGSDGGLPTDSASGSGASTPASEDLPSLLTRLESDPTPHDEHFFRGPISALGRALHERDAQVPSEVIAEEIAFSLHAHDQQDVSSWGLYFGPFMSWFTRSGEAVDSPALGTMTPEVLSYWRERASQSSHPVMRARYADLLWEMPRKLEGARPDASTARIAIDAYLEAVDGNRYEHVVTAIDKAKRALSIALSLSDEPRIERGRDTLVAIEDRAAEDASLGLWGFCFDALIEPPNQRIPVPDALHNKIVSDMEARLERLVVAPIDQYHPAGAEEAALRLAYYHRRRGGAADVARVLRLYGGVVQRLRGTAPAQIVSHSLERLYAQLMAFGLRADADLLNEAIRVAGEESLKDMKPMSTTVEVPREKFEGYFTAMLEGKGEEVLQRIAVHFIPRRDELELQMRELAKKAPLSYLISRSIMDDEGRTVARVGSLESDPNGQLISHISQNMQLGTMWLRETFRRALEQDLVSVTALMGFLIACPLFPVRRQPMLAAGLNAYVSGDSLIAIHVLVPQLEQAIRELAVLAHAPIYSQRQGGGLHVRTLDVLLRDDIVADVLGANVTTYLRVLLTDARGWNVRNSVCHGLAPASLLTMPVADRVIHAMLALALIRERKEGEGDASGHEAESA